MPPDHVPAGYCPKCGYAMDAGVCPECGSEIPARRLASSPRAYRRRRRLALSAAPLAILIIAGFYVVHHVTWVRYAPTLVLLRLQGDEKNSATLELMRRYLAGTLAQTDADRMFDQAIRTDPLRLLNETPAGVETLVSMGLHLALPGISENPAWSLTFHWKIRVDEELVDLKGTGLNFSEVPSGSWAWGFSAPPMQPGPHVIELIEQLVLIRAPMFSVAPAIHQWTVSGKAQIEVQSKPSDDFVRRLSDPSLISTVEAALHIPADVTFGLVPNDSIAWRSKGLPVNVFGRLEVRPNAESPYRFVGYLSAPAALGISDIVALRKVPGIDRLTTLDVRIDPTAPDVAAEALKRGITEFYGLPIERTGVPISRTPDMSSDGSTNPSP